MNEFLFITLKPPLLYKYGLQKNPQKTKLFKKLSLLKLNFEQQVKDIFEKAENRIMSFLE